MEGQHQEMIDGVCSSTEVSFYECQARFDGLNPSEIYKFIDYITAYKDEKQISDTCALNEFPLLLEGDASEWWSCVSGDITSWADALQQLEENYVYVDLNSHPQADDESTIKFLERKKALIAKLPCDMAESNHIDMIYWMLRQDIRERILRSSVQTLVDLENVAKEVEQSLQPITIASRPRPRCKYCHSNGHTINECRKLKKHNTKKQASMNAAALSYNHQETLTKEVVKCPQAITKPVRCSYCHYYGHADVDCRKKKQKLAQKAVAINA